jgi:hypothetical protein
MTSIEDLEKQVDSILKRNDEADLENKINKEYNELLSEWKTHQFVIMATFIILAMALTALWVYSITITDIKTHALAAQNITEFITNLKAV